MQSQYCASSSVYNTQQLWTYFSQSVLIMSEAMLLWKQYSQRSFLSTSGPHKWPDFQLFFILVHIKCQGLSKVRENKAKKYPERHAKNCSQVYQYSGSSAINLSINIMPKDLSLSSLRSFFLQAPFPPGWHSLILLLFEIRELFGFVTEWL